MSKRKIWLEIGIVFSLSLGASAVYSIISLIASLTSKAGLSGTTQNLNPSLARQEWLDFSYQFLGVAFGLAPIALALYLLSSDSSSPFNKIGLRFIRFGQSVNRGLLLALIIGVPGLGLYVLARALGWSAKLVPSQFDGYWWVIPMLLFAALRAALLEEVLVIGYLFDRLQLLGFGSKTVLVGSALLRGTYHLYQGFGGFIGNTVMGLVFGLAYQRWGKVMPLVIAHFALDAVAFVGFAQLSKFIHLP